MKTIWKYEINIGDQNVIEMPKYARVLSAALQGYGICMWALVDTDEECEKRQVHVVGTGWDCAKVNGCQFIGTVVVDPFVWHVWIENSPAGMSRGGIVKKC